MCICGHPEGWTKVHLPPSLCNYMNDKIVGFRFPTVIPASSGHQRSFSLQIKL